MIASALLAIAASSWASCSGMQSPTDRACARLLGLSPAVDFLYEYIARRNAGARDGEWGPLGECFADGAVLEFEGVAVGPFAGGEAIVAAYEQRPPDDEVRVLDAEEEGDTVVARYAWTADPARQAGTWRLTREGDTIARLVVTFERRP